MEFYLHVLQPCTHLLVHDYEHQNSVSGVRVYRNKHIRSSCASLAAYEGSGRSWLDLYQYVEEIR